LTKGEHVLSLRDNRGDVLAGLLDAVPDALVASDSAGIIRFVNRQTERLFGYEPDDLIGLPVEVLVPQSLRSVHRVHRKDLAVRPRTREMGHAPKLSGQRRDGSTFPVDIALSQLDAEDGPLVVAAVRDMSARKKPGKKRDHKERLAAVLELGSQAIISSTLDGYITSWNPAAEKLFGYTSEEVIGRSAVILCPDGLSEELPSILAQTRSGQVVENLESTRVRKDGAVIPVSLTVSPVYDDDGAIIGAASMPTDLTKAQRAYESARSMIESSLDFLVAISPEGKITDVNEATVHVTGVPRDELVGTDFALYFTDPEQAERIYQLVLAEGTAVDYPLTMRHRNGTLTDVLYNASVHRDADGTELGVFAAARDVTRQIQAQRQIAEQRSKEQQRIAELERFQQMTIDRALKVIELKKEVEHLKRTKPGQ
jgi:PAS domain S-box-containing protein